MRKILTLLTLCAAIVFAEEANDDHPLVLDDSNFYTQVVNAETNQPWSDKGWFIKFYAPWCGHCKKLAPVWDELHVKNKEKLHVGKVDCTSETASSLCQHFGIRGYPTLLYFPPTDAPKPTKIDENGVEVTIDSGYFKYSGMRSLESLE